jgi:deoxyribodipyrimidine photo-lyase
MNMNFIHWFRRDLRIEDNDALTYAINNGDFVMPIFILDPFFKDNELSGVCRYRFLLESIIDLNNQLKTINLELTILVGNSYEVITSLLNINENTALSYNYDVQVEYGRIRDNDIVEYCNENKKQLYIGSNQFTMVDDYNFDKWFGGYDNYQATNIWSAQKSNQLQDRSNIKKLNIQDTKQMLITLPKSELYTGGSSNAITKLNSFLSTDFDNYYWQLSRPYLATYGHTSHLSAHIAFGTISTRQVHQIVKNYLTKRRQVQLDWGTKKKLNMSGKAYLERLRWRDGFTNRLVFHPEIEWGNKFEDFDSHYSKTLTDEQIILLEKWKNGTTGYPLVDAAMRQLKKDGWMIFRLRAMCASFLCFHYGISWHYGAIHFMNYLVDGDIAINHWQWQMQAGATNPYSSIFRVYNPTKNIESRDPKLEYIHLYVPESRDCITIDQLLHKYPPIEKYEQMMKDNKKMVSKIRTTIKNKYLNITKIEEEDNQIELF